MKKGFVLWMTGLSGAGKTTIALLLEDTLRKRGLRVERLDGDVVREGLCRDLGFSKEDRERNIERVTFVAKLLARNGVAVICSFISPYTAMRDRARAEIENFIEVYVHCPLEVCIERDVKGLYRKALAGDIPNFTGLSDVYEEPEHPEIEVRTDREKPEESAAHILNWLEKNGYLKEYSPETCNRWRGGRMAYNFFPLNRDQMYLMPPALMAPPRPPV